MLGSKATMYAELFLEMVKDAKTDEQFQQQAERLAHLLRKRGDLRLGGDVVKEVARRWDKEHGKEATVVTQEELTEGLRQRLRHELSQQGYAVHEEQRERVGEGIALFLGNEYLVDGTVRGTLRKLWNQVL